LPGFELVLVHNDWQKRETQDILFRKGFIQLRKKTKKNEIIQQKSEIYYLPSLWSQNLNMGDAQRKQSRTSERESGEASQFKKPYNTIRDKWGTVYSKPLEHEIRNGH